MAAITTNKGVLCHPKITPKERTLLESVFDVPVSIGTVCHGMPYVGVGVVANSNGALTGTYTTGIELGRIEEALDLIP
jgi:translation initiation factor 6